jgi:hypothetical protein
MFLCLLAPRAGKRWCKPTQAVYVSPLKLPLDSARHAPRTARGYSINDSMPKKLDV